MQAIALTPVLSVFLAADCINTLAGNCEVVITNRVLGGIIWLFQDMEQISPPAMCVIVLSLDDTHTTHYPQR